jgi:PDZ domain-containing protein
VLGALALVGALLVGAAAVLPRPYCAFSPGSARPTEAALTVDEGEVFPSEGEIFFTTVSVSSLTLIEEIQANRDASVRVVPEEVGRCNSSAARTQNQVSMDTSKDTAIRVALTVLGYDLVTAGVQITSVSLDTEAGSVLQVGEVITAVAGEPTLDSVALRDLMVLRRPGETIELTLLNPSDGSERLQDLTLGGATDLCTEGEECEPRAVIGVNIRDHVPVLPVSIDIDSGGVGGPSAGLAFTLAIIDYLSEGDLTGGKQVAVTGTIDTFGGVGQVGGVAQKTTASKRRDMDVFIVPSAEFEEATGYAGDDMEVVTADTIEEALAVLAQLGGDAVERVNTQ